MSSVQTVIKKLKLDVLNIEDVPDSFSSEVYKLTLFNRENVYVKIPFNKDKLFRELKVLEILKGVLPVPEVLDVWDGDENISGAMLLAEIRGVPCPKQIDEQLAFKIGMYHAMLHEVKAPGYGNYGKDGVRLLEHNDWRLHIKRNFEMWEEPCKEILEPELYEACLSRFEVLFAALPEPDGPCVVHMDFRPGNILVNGSEVAGIIDFESARAGSSEVDFTKVNRYIWQVNPGTKEAYTAGYQTVRPMLDLETVLPFFDIYDAFSAIVWCKNRGVEKNQSFLQENIDLLSRG
ncbi:aminoglycoside phosphotransferase family protein [Paenibacillus pasadenensis]|uniref:phosphotransferase family protein n=1 Tax=Paenibacillus pasadenensis TaxID=217090 RepID=UPI00203E4FFC|nr:aminoglycoside phosphotransferase family protein [Paenibacillus pasadenensis]MCM3746085.1 aminoglycoside phosphotransferase family protein [Paenibacillus pasadenensis]